MQSKIAAVLTTIMFLLACPHGESAEKRENKASQYKGGTAIMKTYPMGRFSIDIPDNMTQNARISKLRLTEVEEYLIPPNYAAHEKAIAKMVDDRIKEINEFRPPKGMEKALIESRDFLGVGRAKSILHYGNFNIRARTKKMDVLLDAGSVGVWFKNDGTLTDPENMRRMINNVQIS